VEGRDYNTVSWGLSEVCVGFGSVGGTTCPFIPRWRGGDVPRDSRVITGGFPAKPVSPFLRGRENQGPRGRGADEARDRRDAARGGPACQCHEGRTGAVAAWCGGWIRSWA
jgi:hypothetical protein